jgi:hypothetical protein
MTTKEIEKEIQARLKYREDTLQKPIRELISLMLQEIKKRDLAIQNAKQGALL